MAFVGLLLFMRVDLSADYVTQVLPAVLVFGLGLSLTVAPLTATVLGGVAEEHAGIASAVNNATARVAGLLAIAALGAVVAAQFTSTLEAKVAGLPVPHRVVTQAEKRTLGAAAPASLGTQRPRVQAALDDASLDAFRLAMPCTAILVALGGVLSALGIENPKRSVRCADCPGGAAIGASEDLAHAVLPRRPQVGAAR